MWSLELGAWSWELLVGSSQLGVFSWEFSVKRSISFHIKAIAYQMPSVFGQWCFSAICHSEFYFIA